MTASEIQSDEAARRLAMIIPPPENRCAPKHALRWAVGIVAAPRTQSYIRETIASVGRAGFPRPWVFAEPHMPGITLESGRPKLDGYDGPVTLNGDRLGVWPNHIAACWALRHSQRTADCNAYFLIEDDVLLCRGLREYLDEYACWPACESKIGALGLFTHKIFAKIGPGWHQWTPEIYHNFWGAQALAFSRPGMDAWLASPFHCQHQENADPAANRFADNELSRFSMRRRRPIYFACGRAGESLVAHVGQYSSVFADGPGSMPGRHERTFADQSTLAPQWIDPKPLTEIQKKIQVVETETERAARRLPICQVCEHWRQDKGCRRCVTVARKPTPANLGTIQVRCPIRKWL